MIKHLAILFGLTCLPALAKAEFPFRHRGAQAIATEAAGDITTGLTAYWKLDESSGTVAADSAGSAHGTITNTPAVVAGKSGNALDFTSADSDYVSIPNTTLEGLSAWTLSLWVKGTDTHDNVAYGEGNTGNNTPLVYVGNNQQVAGDVVFETRDDAGNSLALTTGDIDANDGNWHLVVVRKISSSSWDLWVDNVQRDTDTTSIGATNLDSARIGSLDRISDGFSDCTVDQVRIYNRSLATADMTKLYNDGV